MASTAAATVVVGVGIVAIDVIDEVATFPRDPLASAPEVQVIAAQLGCSCHWVGTTTNPETDPDAAYAHAELERLGVDCSTSTVLSRGSMPVSYILASRATGSRTIVHSRDLQELQVAEFEVATRDLMSTADSKTPQSKLWFHFEGRNMDAVLQMMLLDYIRDNLGFQDAEAFVVAEFGSAEENSGSVKAVICPWGSDGVFYWHCSEPQRGVRRIASKPLDKVVESIGAGDTFIGACVAALSNSLPLEHALQLACEVATAKCSRIGFEFAVEDRERWTKFVKTAKQGEDVKAPQ